MQDTGKETGSDYPRPAVQTAAPVAVAVRDPYGLPGMPVSGGTEPATSPGRFCNISILP